MVCSDNFRPEDYRYPGSKKLKDGAIPSVFAGNEESKVIPRKPPAKRALPEQIVPENLAPNDKRKKLDLLLEIEELEKKLVEKDTLIFRMQMEIQQRDAIIQDQRAKLEKTFKEGRFSHDLRYFKVYYLR